MLIDAPRSVDAPPGTVDAFFKQPMYYYLGHVSAFVPPGATRLGWRGAGVDTATFGAFLTPDGARVVVVLMNRDGHARDVSVSIPPRGYVNVRMAAHSIRTLVVAATDVVTEAARAPTRAAASRVGASEPDMLEPTLVEAALSSTIASPASPTALLKPIT